jgi:hypothetical protein
MINLSRDLCDLLQARASDGRKAFDIVEATFTKIITTLRRDPRFIDITAFEFELMFANLRGEIERALFGEMVARIHLDDAENAVDLVLGEPESATWSLSETLAEHDEYAEQQSLIKGLARVRELATRAMEMMNRDIAAAARMLSEWSGLSLEFALTVIDELVMLEDVPVSDSDKDSDPLGGDKETSRQRALQLFPTAHALLARKKDHGRAEAALIAMTPIRGTSSRSSMTAINELLRGYHDAQSRILATSNGEIAPGDTGNPKGTTGGPES